MVLKWTQLYFFSIALIFLLALVLPPHLVGQSTINFAQNGGVANHVGIQFGVCSGTGTARNCTFTQPVTCSTVAGSNQYTISGYTPTSDDVGKHLIIGMSFGINGSTSHVGAGGSTYAGQPLRVLVQSVAGNTITGAALTNGSPSADAVNSVTNAECDLETDNGPALQTLVNAGKSVEIPAGNWGFDSGVEITTNNIQITCDPGAVIYDARNDTYAGSYYPEKLFSWVGVSGGGMSGCTYVGTNPGLKYDYIALSVPSANQAILTNNSTGLTFTGLTGMNMWADAFIWMGGSATGTTYTSVTNSTMQGGWAFGPAIVSGNHNTIQNIVTINTGPDIEPDNATEANLTYANSLNQFTTFRQTGFKGGVQFSGGNGTGSCASSPTCITGQSVTNANITGGVEIYPACLSGVIQGTWQQITLASNGSGTPSCKCGTTCSAP